MEAYGGPAVNADCQVLNTEGSPITGLYAAGELAASNWTGYDTVGHGMSSGRIAAMHASAQ